MCVTISILKYFRLECHEEESSYIAIATESKLPDANGNVTITSLPGYTRLAMLCPFVSPPKQLDTLQLHRACIFHQLYTYVALQPSTYCNVENDKHPILKNVWPRVLIVTIVK